MAAGSTYTPIATQTLGSAAATVTFSSIPSTYTDLRLVFTTDAMNSGGTLTCYVNGDTGSNYSYTNLSANGSAVSSARGSSTTFMLVGGQTVAFSKGVAAMDFMNYANTTTNKTMLARTSDASRFVEANVSLWRSTAAINSITMYTYAGNGNYPVGGTFTLYGIAAA